MKSLLNGAAAQAKKSLMGTRIPEPVDDGAKVALDQLKTWVQENEDPVFGFANLMETHEPYSFFRGMDRSLVDETSWSSLNISRWDLVYDEGKHQRDARLTRQYHHATIEYVTRLISDLARELPNTSIIVTSDHGENLGYDNEEGLWAHTSSLSEGVCHVPLDILNAPGDRETVVNDIVSHLDMPDIVTSLGAGNLPTIKRAAAPAETLGMSAGPEPPEDKDYWDRTRRSVWSNDNRWVTWDILDNDPPEWAASCFQNMIQEAHDAARLEGQNEQEIDAATEERLKDLGYR